MKEEAKELAKSMFGKSELQNRISTEAAKMVVGDMITLYGEFRKAVGPGALFFNPVTPDNSTYLRTEDIYKDMVKAEENMDAGIADVLKKLINVIDKNENEEDAVIVTVDNNTLSAHVINPEKAKEQLDKIKDVVGEL